MKKIIYISIICFLIIISHTYQTYPQSAESNPDENIYIMSNMGRISVKIPEGWQAREKNNEQHIISYEDKINIIIDKSNQKTLIDALYDVPEIFNTPTSILNTTEIDTGDYRGIIAQCEVTRNNIQSIISVIDVDSLLIVFFGYCNVSYYQDMVEGFKYILYSIEPNSKKAGYISLNKLGHYQLKLEAGWSVHFEDKKYILTKDDIFAIIMIKLSKYDDYVLALDSIKNEFGFDKLTFIGREIIYNKDYEGVLAEGTGVFKDIKVGVIAEVLRFENDTFITAGIVEYKSFYNNFDLNQEILKIISTLKEF